MLDIPLLLKESGALSGITTISYSNVTCLSIPLMESSVILGWRNNLLIITHLPWQQLAPSDDNVRMTTWLCWVMMKKLQSIEQSVFWGAALIVSNSTRPSAEQSTSSDMLLMSSDKLSWETPALVGEDLNNVTLNQCTLPKYCTLTCWPLLTTLPSVI